tara:strand:- start:36 stop:1238 length:1203 start_codon:yes stop_codon:yes gene_type:complete
VKTRILSITPLLLLVLFVASGCKTKPVKKKTNIVKQPVRTAAMDYQDAMSAYQSGKSSGKVDYKTVTMYLRKALQRQPRHIPARYNLAAVYEEMGKYRLADRLLGQVLQMNEKHKPALYRLSQVKVRQKLHGDALRLFMRYLELDPKSKTKPKMLVNLASLQLQNGNHEAASNTARRILIYDTKSIAAYRILARAYLKQRKYAVVHLVFQLAKKLNKKDARLLNVTGLAYIGQKKYPQALYRFTQATTLNPNLFEAQMNLGSLALNYSDYGRALKAFSQAAQLRPFHKDALLAYAVALRANGKYKQAENIYTKRLLPRYRNETRAKYNLGLLYLRYLKQPKKAKTYLRQYIGDMGSRISTSHDSYTLMKEADQMIKMQAYMKKQQEEMKKQAKKKPAPRK